MIHQVLKKFRAEGRDLQPGDFVETSHWAWEQALIRQKKLGIPSVPQKEYDKLVPINVEKEEVVVKPLSLEANAPESLEPEALDGGAEKSSKRGRKKKLGKKSVPRKRIPPRKS